MKACFSVHRCLPVDCSSAVDMASVDMLQITAGDHAVNVLGKCPDSKLLIMIVKDVQSCNLKQARANCFRSLISSLRLVQRTEQWCPGRIVQEGPIFKV